MKPHLWFIQLMSRLVPRRWRSEWTEEWNAELHYRESKGRPELFRRSLGAFWDAIALQPRRLECGRRCGLAMKRIACGGQNDTLVCSPGCDPE